MFLLQALLKRWYIIAVSILLMASAAFGYVKLFVTPKYSSTIKMYVNNDSNIVDLFSMIYKIIFLLSFNKNYLK